MAKPKARPSDELKTLRKILNLLASRVNSLEKRVSALEKPRRISPAAPKTETGDLIKPPKFKV